MKEGREVVMQIVAANLWNLNPRQQQAIIKCLHDTPDLVVLPELRNDCIDEAEKLFLAKGYTFFHTRVNTSMSLGVASLVPVNHSEVIEQEPFLGRPQYKLELENGITFLGIHLDAPVSPDRYRRRQKQLSFLVEFIERSETPVILAGDFNTYWSESIFERFRTDIVTDSHQGFSSARKPLTWPSILPLFQIDHIVCSKHLKLTKLETGKLNGSDHLPIYGCVIRKEL